MQYRKKPVVVEAFQLTRDVDSIAPPWFTQAVVDEKVFIDSRQHKHSRQFRQSVGTVLTISRKDKVNICQT